MKGRSCIVIIFAVIALLLPSLPGHAKTAAKKEANRASHQPTKLVNPGQNYSVRAGDTLYWIARDFGTTPKALQSANKLKGSKLKIGQVLSIPVSKTAAGKSIIQSAAKTSSPLNETFISAAPAEPANSEQNLDSESVSTRLKLKQAGFDLIGVRYRCGASGNGAFDCSGLVKSLFSKFNIDLPRSSKEQFKQGQKISKDDLQVGDLVFFSSGGSQPTHVGIYVGDDKFLHAARKARKVIVSDLSKIWYTMRYIGARRVMDLWSDEPISE
jgi:peptidoglycan DL-endopeptidase LytE